MEQTKLEQLKDRVMPYIVWAVVWLGSVGVLALGIAENTVNALESNPTQQEWYPWMVDASWVGQFIPELKWKTSHDKFKELCQLYGLDASKIWELESKYNLREWVLLAVLIAETSGGNNWNYVDEGCYNLWNVGNNDSWNRVCFEWKRESIEQAAITLNNKYLWNVLTLGCLSNAWSCVRYFDRGYRYATSPDNWERTITNVMNRIYWDELGQIEPSKFSVRRDFISLQ
jgi:hypothetical protein